MQDDELRNVLAMIVAAVEDLEAAYVAVPPSLREAEAALRKDLDGEDLPHTRPAGHS